MNTTDFEAVMVDRINKCVETLGSKAGEYATEDRLHNFKVAAEIQNCTPITALAGMMAKHTVSVYDLVKKHELGATASPEMWDEKIGDSINYLILLSALVKEDINARPKACAARSDETQGQKEQQLCKRIEK